LLLYNSREKKNGENIYRDIGWSYPTGEGTWKGFFYPPGTKNELEFYSQFFNTVGVNSSFLPSAESGLRSELGKTDAVGFLFAVKLWQKFTHPEMYRAAAGEDAVISYDDIEMFRQSLEPMVQAGKMGALLRSFPEFQK